MLLDKYFQLQPGYQGVPLADLRFKRVLFGGFPCYSDGPLQPHFDRIIQVRASRGSRHPPSATLCWVDCGMVISHAIGFLLTCLSGDWQLMILSMLLCVCIHA